MAIQGRLWESVVFCSLAGTPVSGIAYDEVVVKYRKAEQSAWETKTLTASDWISLGDGYYLLKWAVTDMSTLGAFNFYVSGTGFDSRVYGEFSVDPIPLQLLVPPSVCVVSGNVTDLGGKPGMDHQVVVRGLNFPSRSGNSFVVSDLVKTYPDAFGNFTLPLLRGETVVIEIERSGIKNQIVIPDQPSALLLDLLPPIV